MANNTVSIAIVADAAKAQAAFRETSKSATNMGESVKHSSHEVDEFAERAGDGASRSSQLAGALGDLAGAFENSNGKAGILGKSVGNLASGIAAAAPFVMVATGLFDITEVALKTLTLTNIRAAASFVATRVAMVAGAVATGVMTAAQYALNLALSLNPIGLIVIGIAALIAIIVILAVRLQAVRDVLSTVWDGLKTGAVAAIDFVKSVPDRILGFFTGLADKLKGIGGYILKGLLNGFVDSVPLLRQALESVAGVLPSWIKGPLGIASPSRVLMGVGRNAALGVQAGFQSVSAKSIVGSLPADLAKTRLSANGTVRLAGGGSSSTGTVVHVENLHVHTLNPDVASGKAVMKALAAAGRQVG